MRLTRLPMLLPLVAGAFAAWLIGISTWDETKMGLLTALSVIAAAALVRLARGLPFTNPDHFEPTEVEQVVHAVKQLARSLRAFLGVVLLAMILLVVAAPLSGLFERLWLVPDAKVALNRALSFLVGAALAYVLVRMWQIVASDLSLLDKQASFMVRAVHRKARERDEEDAETSPSAPFVTPEGYGQRLQ